MGFSLSQVLPLAKWGPDLLPGRNFRFYDVFNVFCQLWHYRFGNFLAKATCFMIARWEPPQEILREHAS
jgi:hypothetical protein